MFKLLHRFLGTNSLTYKIGKNDSPRCVNCNLYEEKIEHLFHHCVNVKQIWSKVEEVCSQIVNRRLRFNATNEILLGFQLGDTSRENIIVNKLLLYCKYYIWHAKMNNEKLNVKKLCACIEYHVQFDDMLNDCVLLFQTNV